MNREEQDFVENLLRASIFDIVKPAEVERYISEGILEDQEAGAQ